MGPYPKKNPFILLLLSLSALVIGAQEPPEEDAFLLEPVLDGLVQPWAVAFLPQGGYLITQKSGQLVLVTEEEGRRELFGLPQIRSTGHGGLMDLVLAPDFESSREIFLTLTGGGARGFYTALVKARIAEDFRSLESWEEILTGNNLDRGGFNFGSRILFDQAGHILMTVGDRSRSALSQDTSSHGGKVLRVTRDGEPAPGNPFIGQEGVLPEIYSLGLRNSQGITRRPETGEIWISEHGPQGGDEINILQSGGNYGWPMESPGILMADDHNFTPPDPLPEILEPVFSWADAVAPTNIVFYSGEAFPDWQGDLFVAGLISKQIMHFEIQEGAPVLVAEYLVGWERIRDIRQGLDGHLYILTDDVRGSLYRLVPKPESPVTNPDPGIQDQGNL